LPPYSIDRVTKRPWLTLKFVLPLLPPKVGEHFAEIACTKGNLTPEQLLELHARLLMMSIEKRDQ